MTSTAPGRRILPAPSIPFEEFELRCGARLVVSPRAGAPLTALQLHLRGGLAEDPLERAGLAHLTGALAPEGTERHSDEDLADLLEPKGGSLSGDSSGLAGSVASAGWRTLVDVAAEVATTPTYPRARVERRRANLLDRLAVDADDPRLQAARRFRRLVYGDHWIGRPESGELETVARIDRRHLRAQARRVWTARRALIAVCGDVDPGEVRARFDRRLRAWKPGQPANLPALDLPTGRHAVAAFEADRQQVHLYLGHLGITRRSSDFAAVCVLDHILGTGPGFSNRIAARLRDAEGLAYSVHASQYDSAGVYPGMFTAYIATSRAKVDRALRGFVEEIRRIRRELVRPEELALAVDYLVGSHAMGFERAARRVTYLINRDRIELPVDELERLPERFAAVTREQLRDVAQRHLRPEHLCLAAGGPIGERELRRALDRALGARR